MFNLLIETHIELTIQTFRVWKTYTSAGYTWFADIHFVLCHYFETVKVSSHGVVNCDSALQLGNRNHHFV